MKSVISAVILFSFLAQSIPKHLCSQDMNYEGEGEYHRLAGELDRAEAEIVKNGERSAEDVESQELRLLLNDLEETPYDDLTARARVLLFLEEETGNSSRLQEITAVIQETEKSETREKRMRVAGMVTLSTTLASLALFNIFWLMADRQYARYKDATTQEEADYFQERTQNYEALSYVFGTAGIVSLGISIPLLSAEKNKGDSTRINRD
jgi:hypothetical protein